MQYDVLNICSYILNYGDSKGYSISNLKLQKLLYFIQADFLISKNTPCFFEDIEAWDFGPVVPEAYFKYKIYGGASIYSKEPYDFIEEDDKKLINEIIDKLADYSAADLTNITQHQTPWTQTYNTCKPKQKQIISNDSIFAFFQEKTEEENITYSVCGYDKDNDVIETFAACKDIKAAAKKLAEITTEHLFEELKCKTTNEPFDWFNIIESKNKTVETIATGCVETKNGLKIAKIILND